MLRFEKPFYAAIAAALVVVGGGTYIALVSSLKPPPTIEATSEPGPPPPRPAQSAAAELITLAIDTLPANATVSMDGTKIGVTPLEIEVPKSAHQITLEIKLAGYTTLRQFLVADANQRLRLSLAPVPGAAPPAVPAKSATAQPSASASAAPSASATAAPSASEYYKFQ